MTRPRNPYEGIGKRAPSNAKVAKDANAWADQIRREREARDARSVPAPVVVPRLVA